MKKLPLGIQSFPKLIEENYIYADKTQIIYDLITQGSYYFLSRPRRFGKSLLVSTLGALFSGKKELFKGLAIETLPYPWKQHPVIMISFASIKYTSAHDLENGIKLHLQRIAKPYNITLDEKLSPGEMLQETVLELSKKEKVALLIDEYDYPILQHLHKTDIAEQMREVLKSFYAVIKDLDPYLTFVLLTGVSKFASTSIFSGLNNLRDISLSHTSAQLLGYTENEIEQFFSDYLRQAENWLHITHEELITTMRSWYNGYCFEAGFPHKPRINVYNPFSVLTFLKELRFSNYWFKTGTPTFLINLLKEKQYPIEDFEQIEASESELEKFEVDNIQLKTLLFQTGYLTIRDYIPASGNYVLTFPNQETTKSLCELIEK